MNAKNMKCRDYCQMKPTIAYHIGAHGEISSYLNKLFQLNREALEAEGVVTPVLNHFQKMENKFYSLKPDQPYSPSEQEFLFDMVTDVDDFNKLVISNSAFLSDKEMAVTKDGLYPKLGARTRFLSCLFNGLEIEIYFGIESLATFPCTLNNEFNSGGVSLFNSPEFTTFRWSEVIDQIRSSIPHAKITVFSAEDLITGWPRLIHKMTGYSSVFDLSGVYGFPLDSIEAKERRPFLRSMKATPPKSVTEYVSRLDQSLRKAMVKSDNSLQYQNLGWGKQHIDYYNRVYEEDIKTIFDMPNVEML